MDCDEDLVRMQNARRPTAILLALIAFLSALMLIAAAPSAWLAK